MSSIIKIRPKLVLSTDVIQGLIDNADKIEAAAVIIKWKDQTISAGWSDMDTSTIVFFGEILKAEGMQMARGNG